MKATKREKRGERERERERARERERERAAQYHTQCDPRLFISVLAVSHWIACTLGVMHKFQIERLSHATKP